MSTATTPDATNAARPSGPDQTGFAGRLSVAITIAVLASAALWVGGHRDASISDAIEIGVARAEKRAEDQEQKPHQVRQAIRDQRDTVTFWRTLWMFGDFFLEPASMVLRTLAVSVAFTALAALLGRPTQFEESLADNSLCQVFWAAAAVTAAGLQFMLPNQPVETSMTLLLPPGEYPAVFWYSLRGLDLFALAGWTFMGVWAWRRGQSPWWAAPMIVLFLLGTETMARSSLVYGIEIGMRLAFGEAA